MPATPESRLILNRRKLLAAGGGLAGILATGRAPVFAQTQPKKLVFAHINAVPESAAVAFDWMAKELTARSNGALEMQFFGKTLIPQELEIMNAVKSGSIAMGSPAGAAATVFPEMGLFLVPYLVKDYASAYKMFNGAIGDASHDRGLVRDDDHRRPALREIMEHAHDLELPFGVERARRLVEEERFGIHRERPCDLNQAAVDIREVAGRGNERSLIADEREQGFRGAPIFLRRRG